MIATCPALAEAHGGRVVGVMSSINAVMVHLPRSAVMALALEDEVQWIEPAMPALQECNAENRALTGANVVNASPYNRDGTGVRVLVFDVGKVRATHQDFQGRVTSVSSDTSSIASHATHVAGTVGGAGVGIANNRGMAPGVTILTAGVLTAGQPGWLYTNPVDIETDYTAAYGQGAHIATNSISTNVASNFFDCAWEGDYNVTDAVIDAIVRGDSQVTNHTPFRIVWAAGNERNLPGRCGTTYATIAPPAGSKNHLSIGAVNANDDSMTAFSGWGPTDDGRMKPDFCAPGCQEGGDGGVTSTTSASDTSYGLACGTSMATPTTTGCLALLMQDFRALHPGAADPRNSTLKALLAHSAVDLGNAGPDYQFGYGSIRIQSAIDLMRSGNFRESTIAQNGAGAFAVTVPEGASSLALTLAWDDPAATPNVIPTLVHDLDLEVFSPGGVRAFPWTLDPANPAAGAARTARNTRDNLEQVKVDNPEPGVWTVRVVGTNIPLGLQPFSLVSSAALTGGEQPPSVVISNASVPESLQPAQGVTLQATVTVENDTLAPGSVRLLYRAAAAGPFTSVEMNFSGSMWTANLPGFPCQAAPQIYYQAAGQQLGVITLPTGGASAPFDIPMGTLVTLMSDALETESGWTVGPNTATSGNWERTNPQATAAQPEDDTTPAPGVNCWVTGGTAGPGVGSFDLDGGSTVVTSPTFSMAGAPPSATIEFNRWYHNLDATTYADTWRVEISNNNGAAWSELETLVAGTPVQHGWRHVSRTLGAVGLAGTPQMRLRFRAEDLAPAGVVEAAFDDVVVSYRVCVEAACDGDVNCDGNLDGFDVEVMERATGGDLSDFCQSDPDFNHDGNLDGFDVEAVEQVTGGGPCP